MCTPKLADAPRSFERRCERRTVFARAVTPSRCRCTWGHPSPSSPKMEGRHVLDLPSSQSEKSISCLPMLVKQGGRNPRIQHRVWKWGRCPEKDGREIWKHTCRKGSQCMHGRHRQWRAYLYRKSAVVGRNGRTLVTSKTNSSWALDQDETCWNQRMKEMSEDIFSR